MSSAYSWLAVSGRSPDDTLRDLGLTSGETYEGFPDGTLAGISLSTGWYLVVSERCDYANTRRLRRLSKRCELVTCAVEENIMYASTSFWNNGKLAWEVTHDSQLQAGRHHLEASGKLPPMVDEIRQWYVGEQAAMDQSNQLVDCIMEVPIETARRITGFSFHDALPGEGQQLFHHLDRDRSASKWWQFWRRQMFRSSKMNHDDKLALQQRLFRHVDCLAGLIGPRCFRKAGSMDAAMGYLRQQWSQMGYDIEEEPFNALSDIATNFIVKTPGSSRAEEIVVLGAHYDTVLSTPGADDNASAVAVLLEVSRLLKDHVGKRTARYVAFACEEPPYFNVDSMGSQHHARTAKQRGDDIVGMLCLEMVGYFKDERGSQPYPEEIPKWLTWPLPKRGNFLAALGNLDSWKLAYQFHRGFKRGSRLPVWALPLPDRFEFIFMSDNRAFWEQGYPALMLTDTAFVRNPNYHQASDTPDTLDYVRMAEVALGVASAMKRLLK